jgi:hypothetical protein
LDSESERDARLYAKCLKQALEPLYYPKYMVKFGLIFKKYIPIPDEFSNQKKNAEVFCNAVNNNSVLIQVSTDEGKRILLEQKLKQGTVSSNNVKMLKEVL